MELKDENQKAFAAILDNLQLRVLGYQEDEETWVALALEMDIRGRGKSFAEAQEELEELIEMQIGFAIFKNMPELVFRPAEARWFERWDRAQLASMKAFKALIGQVAAQAEREDLSRALPQTAVQDHSGDFSRMLSVPPAYVIANLHSNFAASA